MAKLKDRIAVTTGGSSGIGLAVAQRFEEEGAYVFITGRRQAELDKAVGLIGKQVEAVQGRHASGRSRPTLRESHEQQGQTRYLRCRLRHS